MVILPVKRRTVGSSRLAWLGLIPGLRYTGGRPDLDDWQSCACDGGSSGIGRATALAFAREGARVAIGSRRKSKAEEVVRAIRDRGGDAVWLQADVTDAAQVRTLVDRTVAAFGGLDYAFNNGGSGGKARLTAEMDERDWDETIDGYLKSVWLCMCSERATFVVGSALAIDGGYLA
jgi:nucleoside-diphosphate-sugar epimerase